MTTSFSHLHLRSGFSYGFGVATPEELVETADKMGMRPLATTDQNGLYGVPSVLRIAEAHGVRPVIGAQVSIEVSSGHLVLLADGLRYCKGLSEKAIPSILRERKEELCRKRPLRRFIAIL